MAAAEVAPEVRELSRALLPDSDALGARMAERVAAAVPSYAREQFITRDELIASCASNMRYVLGQLSGEPGANAEGPRTTGISRAEQGVPYAAVLEAFRVGGRFIWEVLVEKASSDSRDVLLLAAADIWAVSDDLAAQVTDAYRSSLADQARRDGQRRAVLVGTILDGDFERAEELWQSAGALNLQGDGAYVVVSAECESAGAEGLNDIERVLRKHNVASAWRLDHDRQDGLVALRFGFDVDRLVESLAAAATGRVGVSAPFERITGADGALRAARTACLAATPASTEVVRFDDRPLPVLVATAPEQARSLAITVLGGVLDLPAEDRRLLVQTARVWLDAAGSSSAAARDLHVHRNTVRYRLRRLEELSGRDLAHPVQAAEVHVALECARILDLV
ncbi:PucR family transcriptional regulator [Nocardioides humilatus]|uniref:PucR family transcriptional regulator n=1 Tax=Nocardioides humilatus TaxID=2607660 RepID=A0A5B1LK59_9ACTN|nr:helix-turn-helix domain-containing protein [Nocardioides humilatus]KAA1420943.1 PucR family transcriptional regulator [Nocardioides humilatus]